MSKILCGECKNHYKRGGWHCWSGNKSLGLCNQNGTPNPLAKFWNYRFKRGKVVLYKNIPRGNL